MVIFDEIFAASRCPVRVSLMAREDMGRYSPMVSVDVPALPDTTLIIYWISRHHGTVISSPQMLSSSDVSRVHESYTHRSTRCGHLVTGRNMSLSCLSHAVGMRNDKHVSPTLLSVERFQAATRHPACSPCFSREIATGRPTKTSITYRDRAIRSDVGAPVARHAKSRCIDARPTRPTLSQREKERLTLPVLGGAPANDV